MEWHSDEENGETIGAGWNGKTYLSPLTMAIRVNVSSPDSLSFFLGGMVLVLLNERQQHNTGDEVFEVRRGGWSWRLRAVDTLQALHKRLKERM